MKQLRLLIICLLTTLSGSLFGNSLFSGSAEIGLGYDYFRSLPEGSWEGNTGGLISINTSSAVPCWKNDNYGIQLGGSFGVYDWHGRESAPSGRQGSTQKQTFFTVAIFRTTPCDSGFNFGLAYDWVWNKNFGVFALETKFGQLRFQGGYLLCQRNEFGLWGTLDLHSSHRSTQQIPITYRAISQINAYWRHIFDNCSETMVWAGVPYKKSLMYSTGRAGKFIIGGSFKAPLSNRLAIEGHASYMNPHSGSGASKQRNYAANLCMELKWALFCNPCSKKPYMPIGNNSNFIVDTNGNY